MSAPAPFAGDDAVEGTCMAGSGPGAGAAEREPGACASNARALSSTSSPPMSTGEEEEEEEEEEEDEGNKTPAAWMLVEKPSPTSTSENSTCLAGGEGRDGRAWERA